MIYRRWYRTPEDHLQSEIITKSEFDKVPRWRRIKVGSAKLEQLIIHSGDVTIEGDEEIKR